MSELRKQLREFITQHFLLGGDAGLADDASFLEGGIVDSTGVLELVTHIESTYGFKVADDELVPDNLDSVNSLVEFVQRKTREAVPGPSAP
jgi:acyl carrier protein